jgi:hypothetical protein
MPCGFLTFCVKSDVGSLKRDGSLNLSAAEQKKICSRESDVTGNFRFAGKNRKHFAARPIAPGKVGRVVLIVYFSEKTRKKEEPYFFRSRTTAR